MDHRMTIAIFGPLAQPCSRHSLPIAGTSAATILTSSPLRIALVDSWCRSAQRTKDEMD